MWYCLEIAELISELGKREIHFWKSTLGHINVSYSLKMHVGSLITYCVLEVDREQSKADIIQLSKTIILTSITWNKEKCFIHYQNWPLSTKDESTIIIILKTTIKSKAST